MSSFTIVVYNGKHIVNVDYLDYGVRDVDFGDKVLNQYGTYDQIAKKLIDDPGYTYLYCELLDATNLTIITLKVKSPHIHVHEKLLQNIFYVKIENFGVEGKSQTGFKKGDMLVLIIVESTILV